jgi:hypothetical protein
MRRCFSIPYIQVLPALSQMQQEQVLLLHSCQLQLLLPACSLLLPSSFQQQPQVRLHSQHCTMTRCLSPHCHQAWNCNLRTQRASISSKSSDQCMPPPPFNLRPSLVGMVTWAVV